MVTIATLVVSRDRPDLVERQVELLARIKLPNDLYVVEMGTTPDNMSKWSTLRYADDDLRGECFGHNLALNFARQVRKYDYYLVVMNDVLMNFDGDPVARMIEYMDRHPNLGLISPTCEDGTYPASARSAETGLRPVTSFDYLCFLIRGELVERVGFLNPDFKYGWGALHELTHKMYRSGYFAAYLDDFSYSRLGGISRQEHQHDAGRFASDYFRTVYGPDWSRRFWETSWHYPIAENTYDLHRRLWASGFTPEELRQRGEHLSDDDRRRPDAAALRETSQIRLHLGCGRDYRPGWINIDGNTEVKVDLVSNVIELPYFGNASSDVIEANHVFEHLTRDDAEKAMAEYARVLRPGGALFLELPDADRCRHMLGAKIGSDEYELGCVGYWGYPPEIRSEGMLQIHKWGWSPQSLMNLMKSKGFVAAFPQPVTQTGRPAYRYRRDMRICGIR